MEHSIRPATEGDATTIATVFNHYVAKATMVLLPRNAEDYAPLITNERAAVFVAADADNHVSGFAYVKPYSDRGGYALAGEITIFLDPELTGKGLGEALYATLMPVSDTLGYRHLTARIWANNAGSIRFHKRHGFRLVGTQVGIGLVGDKRIDTVIMEKVW